MIKLRKSEDRGHAEHGWLKSHHTFSFADYHDPKQMGFSALRVINEDFVAGGAGFPTHAHRDMEIITYIVDGVLEHKDSMGNTATISPGEVQRMSAGTGVRHSEYNHLKDKKTHLLQIWILPDQANYPAGYEQKDFSSELAKGDLVLVASNDGRNGSVSMNQDAEMYAAKSKTGGEKILNTDETRFYWLQVVKGIVKINDITLGAGDGAYASLETRLQFKWQPDSEFLLFDLP
jgi:quercetin 2,3-dioxygenase